MLTPDAILAKDFTATSFRRGYNEQEVDDFLDEVAADLRQRITLHEAEMRLVREQVERFRVELRERPAVTELVSVPAVALPAPQDPAQAAGILALAQQLHDQYVAEGEELLTAARERAAGIIAQAATERDNLAAQIRDLATERADVRDGLRMFFREQMTALDKSFPELPP
jgi:DivIVA domain-containing protein